MAQADCVTTPICTSIPGVGVEPSTSLARAVDAELFANRN